MIKIEKSIRIQEMQEPIYLCTWNGGDIVEIHTEKTLNDDYSGSNFDEEVDHTLTNNSMFNWCQTIPTKAYGKAKSIKEVFNYFKNEKYSVGHTWEYDNMEIQRIK